MHLNHLDLQVSNVPSTAALLEELLGLRVVSNRDSAAIAILEDGAGFTLVLQRRKHPEERYPEGFHFGCLVGDEQTVVRFHESARGHGLQVSEVQRNGRGVLCYALLCDGILLEVSWHRPPGPDVSRRQTMGKVVVDP
jgi:catechol 2,3-dioxygenase-like lactoylglutathione lyase family enzyme